MKLTSDKIAHYEKLIPLISSPEAQHVAIALMCHIYAITPDAELGELVRKMPPAHFIGREYAEVLHDVNVDWDFCKVENGEYTNLANGATPEAALKAAYEQMEKDDAGA